MVAKACQSTSNPEPIFHKTKLCKFYAKGACTKGEKCVFAHGHRDLSSAPDFSYTSICPFFMRSSVCPNFWTCKFAHSAQQLRPRVTSRAAPVSTTTATFARRAEVEKIGQVKVALQERISCAHQRNDKLNGKEEEPQDGKRAGIEDRSGFWSRQTTAESDQAATELEESEDDFGLDDTDSESLVERGLDDSETEEERHPEEAERPVANDVSQDLRRGSELDPTPPLVVKNTFIDGAEDGCAPVQLRKVHSSPSLVLA